jgi:hypothetical protein
MDYEVFLVSSMREQWTRTRQARPSIIQGTRQASREVTAAALIMFCVFASFVSMDDAIIKPIAFALAFGVLVDAFLVRTTLVQPCSPSSAQRPGGCPDGWTGCCRTSTSRADHSTGPRSGHRPAKRCGSRPVPTAHPDTHPALAARPAPRGS